MVEFEEDTDETDSMILSALVSVAHFGTGVMVETDQCDGISPLNTSIPP